jgi:hypothetical protein
LLDSCSCGNEGKPACHRCLLRYARNEEFPLMSRVEALDMLNRLLDDWRVERGTRTNEISLIDQVESELEMRFLNKLMAWGGEPSSPVRIEKRTDRDGARVAELRFTAPNGRDVTHWQMKLQNTIRGSRPDVRFKRLDAASPEVVVFLDGFKYHASIEYNRLADDADKRARLRAHDYIVFGITWEDVDSWGATAEDSSWAPYRGLAQQAARSVYRQLVPDSAPNDLERYVWTNPVELLMHFLADPDPHLWCRRAEAALAGMLALPEEKTAADSSGIGSCILAALRGEVVAPAGSGDISRLLCPDCVMTRRSPTGTMRTRPPGGMPRRHGNGPPMSCLN